ncbi:hypothetical protein CPAR01_16367 [Colletotrichum paranaense]|uniref:Uncharacterized protein n=1 Tax=Colletotrichum paranaense TaxID=1914294 RepID=A0ABQ9RWN0_9PEZI|nr:uncharacterized protein CPAR01_16367 [Colletotrichum paranaense]KAK1516751.1 hypothetical protein CPAR01_16367 [Colletotrichum paranaense]
MLRMFSGMNGLGGSLLAVIVLMALVFAASRFDFVSVSLLGVVKWYSSSTTTTTTPSDSSGPNRLIQILTSGKSKDGDLEGEDDSTYAFYASKRRRASSVKRVTFDI